MRKISLLLVTVFLLSFLGTKAQSVYSNYVDGYLSFKFQDSYASDFRVEADNRVPITEFPFLLELAHEFGITEVTRPFGNFHTPEMDRIINVKFDSIKKVDLFVRKLTNYDFIEFAEKKVLYKLLDAPNDPYYTKTYLYSGSTYNLRWHLDVIKADSAWAIRKASSDIKIGIVDNAVWGEHPDLQIPGNRQFNGMTETVGNSSPPDSIAQNMLCPNTVCSAERWSHGTHCAGLAGAIMNNNEGIATVGSGVTLLGANASLPAGGIAYASQSVDWMIGHGVKVINMSYGTAGFETSETKAYINAAYAAGIILVAGAGNDGDTNNPITYPAANPKVLSVASVNSDKKLSNFSEYGTWVNIASPGGYDVSLGQNQNLRRTVFSTIYSQASEFNVNFYGTKAGTSMASPITAGLCGLLLTRDPNLTFERIKYYLQSTSQQRVAYTGRDIQSGVIDAYAALKAVGDSMPTVKFEANNTIGAAPLTISFTDNSDLGNDGTFKSRKWYFPGGDVAESTDENPIITYTKPGIYNAGLVVTNNYTRNDFRNSAYYLKDSLVLENYINVKLASGIDTLYTDRDSVTVGVYVNNTSKFQVITSSMDWKIDSASVPSWLSYTIDSLDKTGNGIVTLLVKTKNSLTTPKYATLLVINTATSDTAEVMVMQEPADILFKVGKSVINAAAIQSMPIVTIESNINWSVTSSTIPDWISLNKMSGTPGITPDEQITVRANPTYESRTATIEFKADSIVKTIVITQKGQKSTLEVDPLRIEFKGSIGDSAQMQITTGYNWQIKNGPTWLTISPNSGSGNSSVWLVTREENKSNKNDSKVLSIIAIGVDTLTEAVTVVQKPFSAIETPTIENLKIYPNPVKDKLVIENGNSFVKEYCVLDISGRTLLVQPQTAGNVEIDLGNLAQGAYMVRIIAKDGTQYLKKITKQ